MLAHVGLLTGADGLPPPLPPGHAVGHAHSPALAERAAETWPPGPGCPDVNTCPVMRPLKPPFVDGTHLSAGGPELPLEKFKFHLNAYSWETLQIKQGIRDPLHIVFKVITENHLSWREAG